MVPCPRCLTTHNERESKKSWQDFSFFKRDAPAEPPQPQAQALLRVSQVLKRYVCGFLKVFTFFKSFFVEHPNLI